MVITAQSGISGLTSVGGTKIGQDTGGNALLFLQSEDHELVFSGGNVQAVNRSCTAAAAADFDNDMDLDVFFACSGQLSNLPDIVYENQGNGTFVALPAAGGAEGQMPLGRADSVMVADYDEDCRMDVYVTNGHHFRPSSYAGIHQLFRNTTSDGNHCIQIDLEGTVSNRDGIGAIVYATTPDGTVQKRDQNGGKHKKAQDYQRVHIGLGTNQSVDLEVHWPSGIVETFANVAADQVVELVEGTGGTGPSYSLSVDDPTVTEGSDTQALFTVNLSPAPGAGETVLVDYQTANGSAQAGSDYTSTSGQLSFGEGDSSLTVSVPILDDGTAEPNETFTLQASSSEASPASGTATIQDDDGSGGDPTCGMPTFDPAVDRGVYLWNDCGTNDWHLRITGGGSGQYLNHLGTLVADAPFVSVDGFSVEANDTLDVAGSQIDFGLIVGGVYEDGIDFTLAEGASVCFTLTSPSGLAVFGGVDADPVSLPVSMPGFGDCGGGGGDPTDPTCGMPTFDPASDRGVYLWKDCGTDDWHLRITGGSSGQYLNHIGQLVADAPFLDVSGVSIEGNDTLDIGASQVDFGLIVGGIYEDGIDFTLAEGASVCFSLTSPSGLSVFGGVDADPVTLPVSMPGFGACDGGGGDPTDPTCGMPSFDPASDRGAFLWKDCGTDDWHLRITGGGNGQYVGHVGSLVADAPFVSVDGVSIEANDTFDITASQVDFGLIVGGIYEDGIDFTLSQGSSACFTLDSPTDVSVFGGVDGTDVGSPVGVPGFGACAVP
nr:Calx-beta domain-containing protein [Thiorhodococcus minor]